MHPLSAVVTGLLVTAGAGLSLLETDGDFPLHFGNQDSSAAGGGNETGNGTAGNETEEGGDADGGEADQGGNETSESAGNETEAQANETAENETAGNETEEECYDMEDCYVHLSDSGDVWLSGDGEWTWRVTDEMRYVRVYLYVSSNGAGLTDSIDATLRDGAGRVVGHLQRDGSLGGDHAVLEVDLDRTEDDFFSGEWELDLEMEMLHGYYDVWIEASCEETDYYGWW